MHYAKNMKVFPLVVKFLVQSFGRVVFASLAAASSSSSSIIMTVSTTTFPLFLVTPAFGIHSLRLLELLRPNGDD